MENIVLALPSSYYCYYRQNLFYASSSFAPVIVLTQEEKAWLDANPIIHLGNGVAWPPMGYLDKNGHYTGMSADYMEYIGNTLGIRIEPAKLQSWKATIEAARKGDVDILDAVVPTPQREKYLTFTKPYMSHPVVIFTREDFSYIADMETLNGQRVAMTVGSAIHDLLINNHPDYVLYPVENI